MKKLNFQLFVKHLGVGCQTLKNFDIPCLYNMKNINTLKKSKNFNVLMSFDMIFINSHRNDELCKNFLSTCPSVFSYIARSQKKSEYYKFGKQPLQFYIVCDNLLRERDREMRCVNQSNSIFLVIQMLSEHETLPSELSHRALLLCKFSC